MVKKTSESDPVERARRRLVRAQALLQQAQADRTRALAEGARSVEKARRAAERSAKKATLRVEERHEAVAQIQRELEELLSSK